MITRSANVKNSIWNTANILLYPIAFLAATPFFLNQMGASVFGVWMLVNAYVYIAFNVLGFGLPNSVTVHVAESQGQQNRARLYGYINAGGAVLGRLSLLMLTVSLLLFIAYRSGWHLFDQYTMKVLIPATVLIALKFPELLFQSVFKGYERYDLAGVFNIANRIGALILQAALVFQGYGLFAIFMAALVVNLITVLAQALQAYSMWPGFKLQFIRAVDERFSLYRYGFWTWLQTLIGVASFQIDRFIVAWFLGTEVVAFYVLAATIANQLHLAFEAMVGWLFPKVARLKEQIGDTREYFHTLRGFSVGLSLTVMVSIHFFGGPLFTLWLGEEYFNSLKSFLLLFIVFELFLILTIVPKIYLNAIKSMRLVTAIEFFYKSALVAGMIIGFIVAGTAESLIIGQIAALMLSLPLMYYLINRKVLKENTLEEVGFTMLPSLALTLAIATENIPVQLAAVTFSALVFGYYYIYRKKVNPNLLLE